MDRPRHELLAGSALAQDENRELATGGGGDQLLEPGEIASLADKVRSIQMHPLAKDAVLLRHVEIAHGPLESRGCLLSENLQGLEQFSAGRQSRAVTVQVERSDNAPVRTKRDAGDGSDAVVRDAARPVELRVGKGVCGIDNLATPDAPESRAGVLPSVHERAPLEPSCHLQLFAAGGIERKMIPRSAPLNRRASSTMRASVDLRESRRCNCSLIRAMLSSTLAARGVSGAGANPR